MKNKKFINWDKLHHSEKAVYWLALLAFLESSVFLLPVDVLYIPMILHRPKKAYHYAFIATIFSILGAVLGWTIGAFAYNSVALPILQFYGKASYLEQMRQSASLSWIVLFLLTSGLVHIPPIKLVNILSGFIHINLFLFIILNATARFSRLYLLAWLTRKYGEKIMHKIGQIWRRLFIDRYKTEKTIIWLQNLLFFGAISSSLFLQYYLGYAPCELCLYERWLLIASLLCVGSLLLLRKKATRYYVAAFLFSLFVVGSNFLLCIYHYGVEQHWWRGPDACSSVNIQMPQNPDDLLYGLQHSQIVACDIVSGTILNLPFTFWGIVVNLIALAGFVFLYYLRNSK